MLLDEPTAHLAPAAAAAIGGVIRGPLAGRTIIVVSHRCLDTTGASQVITLDGGRPAETSSGPASTLTMAAAP